MSEYHANTPIIYRKIIVYFNTNKQIKHKTKYKNSPRQKTHESHRSRTNKFKKKPTQMIYPNKRLMHG